MKHVVVWIISKKDDPQSYFLISSHTDFGKFTGYFYPPGWHVEEGEDEPSALTREIKEELGVMVIRTEKITDTKGDVADQKTSWYFCDVDSFDFNIDHSEIDQAGFFTQEEMMTLPVWPATQCLFEEFVFGWEGRNSLRN